MSSSFATLREVIRACQIHDSVEEDSSHIIRYLKVIESREERLLDFLSSGSKSLDQITRAGIIYGPPKIIAGCWDLSLSEKAMMKKHLELLEQQGNVTFEEGLFHLRS